MAITSEKITEYQEGNRIGLAYGQLTLMAGSIFISMAFTIFGISFTIQSPSLIALVMMGISSVMLYLIYLAFNERYGKIRHKVIFPMLQKFEQENMTMKFHTEISLYDKEMKKYGRINHIIHRIRFWNYFSLVALMTLWIFRIIFKQYI